MNSDTAQMLKACAGRPHEAEQQRPSCSAAVLRASIRDGGAPREWGWRWFCLEGRHLELSSWASLAARRTMRSSRVPMGNQQATSARLAASISLLISSRPRFSAHSLSSCTPAQKAESERATAPPRDRRLQDVLQAGKKTVAGDF